ncbi:MAG: hypothetical protein AAGF02_01215 [Actinomycetota bacterium]
MERYVLAVGLLVVAVGIALVLERRRTPASVPSRRYRIPTHLDRLDFPEPEAPWLLAVFTSTTCDSCRGVLEAVEPLRSPDVAVADVPFQLHRDLHRRYEIDAVPAAVAVDVHGEVKASWLGVIDTGELWTTVSDLVDGREPPPPS